MPSGPNGAQIVIDGMVNNATRLPTKSTILEVRINSNPFSAENDRIGFGQIQIITRPRTEKLRGQGYFNFNDESLNSRNPFVQRKSTLSTAKLRRDYRWSYHQKSRVVFLCRGSASAE